MRPPKHRSREPAKGEMGGGFACGSEQKAGKLHEEFASVCACVRVRVRVLVRVRVRVRVCAFT